MIQIVLLLLLFVPQDPPTAKAPLEGIDALRFLVGHWTFSTRTVLPDGRVHEGKAYSKVEYTLDGQAIVDTYHQMVGGRAVALGSTVRGYDPRIGKFRMLFYSTTLGDQTRFEGELVDGELRFNGKGTTNGREFIERVTFHDLSHDAYSWRGERSYDKGKTWKPFFSYRATRGVPQWAGG